MRVARWWKAGAVLVFMALAPLAQAQRVAMVGGTLVDGTLSDPIRDSVVLIEGQRIVAVGTVKTLPVPADATVISTEGMTVLFVEHDMHMVRHIADWVVVMAEGRVVAEGDPHEVMANPAVIDAYLGSHHDEDLGDLDTGVMTAIKELADDDADQEKN